MHLFAFILIGGIWAAFLLPSLLDGRRQAPMSSTRSFARSKDLLASVAGNDTNHVLQKRRNTIRRKQILAALGISAALSLIIAIAQSSGAWLAVTIGFDVAIAGYVTLLLFMQQGVPVRAPVVSLPPVETPPLERVAGYEYEHGYEQNRDNATVRIVAS